MSETTAAQPGACQERMQQRDSTGQGIEQRRQEQKPEAEKAPPPKPTARLRPILDALAPIASRDPSRHVLNFVHAYVGASGIRKLTAVDGRLLVLVTLHQDANTAPWWDGQGQASFIIRPDVRAGEFYGDKAVDPGMMPNVDQVVPKDGTDITDAFRDVCGGLYEPTRAAVGKIHAEAPAFKIPMGATRMAISPIFLWQLLKAMGQVRTEAAGLYFARKQAKKATFSIRETVLMTKAYATDASSALLLEVEKGYLGSGAITCIQAVLMPMLVS